jgi:hypothetical protein
MAQQYFLVKPISQFQIGYPPQDTPSIKFIVLVLPLVDLLNHVSFPRILFYSTPSVNSSLLLLFDGNFGPGDATVIKDTASGGGGLTGEIPQEVLTQRLRQWW